MTTAVRYYSRSGNTEAVAIPIAQAVHTDALPISDPLPTGRVDLLFLGGAMYAFHLAKPLREFIDGLSPESIGAVAVFSTAGNPGGASRQIAKQCEKRGLRVLPNEFHCTGGASRKPETADAAAAFAKRAAASLGNAGAGGPYPN